MSSFGQDKAGPPVVSKARNYRDYRWKCCHCCMEHLRDRILCDSVKTKKEKQQGEFIRSMSATCGHKRCIACAANWRPS